MGGDLGNVNFKNVTVASCKQHGISFERIVGVEKDVNKVDGAIVVGASDLVGGSTSVGIVGPQSDKWLVDNARFYKFPDGAGGIGQCTHCLTPKGDSGARTYRFQNLKWDDPTVPKRVKYLGPFKGIFNDLDGTLTGLGANSFATAYWKHNDWPECTVDLDVYDGIICPPTTSVRRIVFHQGDEHIMGKKLYIWQYDDSITSQFPSTRLLQDAEIIAPNRQLTTTSTLPADLETYLTKDYGSEVEMVGKANPGNHWTVPYVTGHKYYFRWEHGLDFEKVKVQIIDWLWEDVNTVEMVMPYYEYRAAINFTPSTGLKANETYTNTSADQATMGMNYVDTNNATRQATFVVNGRDGSSSMTIEGFRCVVDCAPILPPVPEEPEPEEIPKTNLWSDPITWTGVLDNRIPMEGDWVQIPPGYEIIYDVGISPLFNAIEVNGKLTFKEGQPSKINTRAMWVRAGTMEVGSPSTPFDNTVEICLHGNNTSVSEFIFSPNIQVGNKNFIVTGTVNLYGAPRDTSSRLLSQAYPGQDNFFVNPYLDWKAGDILGLAATNMDARNYETVTIKNYTADNGHVFIEEKLEKYHFGQFESTGEQYRGVDMRGEVMMLSRNIKITADYGTESMTKAHPDPWPCRVLVADFFEPADFTYRKGTIDWDYVGIYNCSQTDTQMPALKFDNAVQGVKTIKNSAIATGRGQGIHIYGSQRVTLINNVIHDFVLYGVRTRSAGNLDIQNNIVSGVRPDKKPLNETALLKWDWPTGGFDLHSATAMTIYNNSASGTWHFGFRMPAIKCEDTSPVNKISDNTAHSVSGFGVIVSAGGGSKCSEFTKFVGYKNELASIHMNTGAHSLAKDNIVIDSAYGLAVFAGSGGHVEVKDNYIYGSKGMLNSDCPLSENGKCGCKRRQGVIAPTFGGNPNEVPQDKKIPKMFSQGGGWGGTSMFYNNRFIGFDSHISACGGRQAAIGNNHWHPDYHPISHYRQNKFIDTDESGMFLLFTPPQGWANLSDCGTFTCTGLYNSLLRMERNSYSGVPSVFGLSKTFEVTANNKESTSTQVTPTCEKKDTWNAYICEMRELGVLLFESQDADRMDRSSQPLYIMDDDKYDNCYDFCDESVNKLLNLNTIAGNFKNSPTYNNRLNAYMDHVWDGAYTGQKREQRFPTIIDANKNYTIEYTGTPPFKQKFTHYGEPGTKGFLVTIRYPDAGAYKVYDETKRLATPTDWDYNIETWAKPSGRYCGENRYQGVINRLQFWIEPGCTLYVVPRDAIMLAIRLEWTVKSFFQEKAIGKFTDRMAAVLGIHKADIKVVQVYEGSVIVEFQVLSEGEPGESNTQQELQAISDKFEQEATKLGNQLGAPVMSIMTNGGSIKPMPGYENQVQAQSAREGADFNDLISEFLENRPVNIEYEEIVIPADQSEPNTEDQEEKDLQPKEREVVYVSERVTLIEKEEQVSEFGLILLMSCLLVLIVIILVVAAVLLMRKRHANKHPKKIVLTDLSSLPNGQTRNQNQEDTVLDLDRIAESKQYAVKGHQLGDEWIGSVIGNRKRKYKDGDEVISASAASSHRNQFIMTGSANSSRHRDSNMDYNQYDTNSALPIGDEAERSSRASRASNRQQDTPASQKLVQQEQLNGDLEFKTVYHGGHGAPELIVENVETINQLETQPANEEQVDADLGTGIAILNQNKSNQPGRAQDQSIQASRLSKAKNSEKQAEQNKPKKLQAAPKFVKGKGHQRRPAQDNVIFEQRKKSESQLARPDPTQIPPATATGGQHGNQTSHGAFGGLAMPAETTDARAVSSHARSRLPKDLTAKDGSSSGLNGHKRAENNYF